MSISYEKALQTIGDRVHELRQADPEKDFWAALDKAIAEVGGVQYGPNETRSKLGYALSGSIVRGKIKPMRDDWL